MKYVFLAYRSWAINAISKFIDHNNFNYKIITTTEHEINLSRFSKKNIIIVSYKDKDKINNIIKEINPDHVFLIGWSWIISLDLIKKFSIFCFHPSDLPNYRGGSPIQHQILDNLQNSKMTMFQLNDKLDGGPIYKKKNLKLNSSMRNIFFNLEKTSISLLKYFHKNVKKNKLIILQKQLLKNGFIRKRIKTEKSFISFHKLIKYDYKYLKNLIKSLESPSPNLKINKKQVVYLIKTTNDLSTRPKKGYSKIKIKDRVIYLKLSLK